MKYTILFLKYIVVVSLVLIMLMAFVTAGILTLVGVVGALTEKIPRYLLIIPIALLIALLGFVAFDCLRFLMNKWEI